MLRKFSLKESDYSKILVLPTLFITILLSSNAYAGDTDGDQIDDMFEMFYGWNPFDSNSPGDIDTDGDGLTDKFEFLAFTDFYNPNNPVVDGNTDPDSDTLPNGYEVYLLGTDINKADTDCDGTNDNLDKNPLDGTCPTFSGFGGNNDANLPYDKAVGRRTTSTLQPATQTLAIVGKSTYIGLSEDGKTILTNGTAVPTDIANAITNDPVVSIATNSYTTTYSVLLLTQSGRIYEYGSAGSSDRLVISAQTQQLLDDLYASGEKIDYIFSGRETEFSYNGYGAFAALTSTGKLISWSFNNDRTIDYNTYGTITDPLEVSEGFMFVDDGKIIADWDIPQRVFDIIGNRKVVDVVSSGLYGYAALLDDGDVAMWYYYQYAWAYTEADIKAAGIENVIDIYGGPDEFYFIKEDGSVVEAQKLYSTVFNYKTITFANGKARYIAPYGVSTSGGSYDYDKITFFVDEDGKYLVPESGVDNFFAATMTDKWTENGIKSVTMSSSLAVIQDQQNNLYLTELWYGRDFSSSIPDDIRQKIESKEIVKVVSPVSAGGTRSGILTNDNTLYTFYATVNSGNVINGFTNFEEITDVVDAVCTNGTQNVEKTCYYQKSDGTITLM